MHTILLHSQLFCNCFLFPVMLEMSCCVIYFCISHAFHFCLKFRPVFNCFRLYITKYLNGSFLKSVKTVSFIKNYYVCFYGFIQTFVKIFDFIFIFLSASHHSANLFISFDIKIILKLLQKNIGFDWFPHDET